MPHRVRAVIKQIITEELKDPKSELRAQIMSVASDAVPEFFQTMLDGKKPKPKPGPKAKPGPKPTPAPEPSSNGVKITRLQGHKQVIIKSLPGAKRRWGRWRPTPADYATDPWKYDDIVCDHCGPDTGKTHLTKCPNKRGAIVTRTWRPESITK